VSKLKVVLPSGWHKLPIGTGAQPADVLAAMGIRSQDRELMQDCLTAVQSFQDGCQGGRVCLAASFGQVVGETPVGAGLLVSTLEGFTTGLTEQELLWKAEGTWTVEGRVSLAIGTGLLRQRVAVMDAMEFGNPDVYAAQMLVEPFADEAPLILAFSSPNVEMRAALLRLFLAIASSLRIVGG